MALFATPHLGRSEAADFIWFGRKELVLVSLWIAGLGCVTSALIAVYFKKVFRAPVQRWFLGLSGLLPTWVFSLLMLLGALKGAEGERVLKVFLMSSSAAAVLGAIATEFGVRYLGRKASLTGQVYLDWLLGALALVPSWAILLRGLVLFY